MPFYLLDSATRIVKQVFTVAPSPTPEESVVEIALDYVLRSRQNINTGVQEIFKVKNGRETLATESEIDAYRSSKEVNGVRTYYKLDEQNQRVVATTEEIDAARIDPEREAIKHREKMRVFRQALNDASLDDTLPRSAKLLFEKMKDVF